MSDPERDIVERLRAEGADAFAKHYSLGMFKLCADAADEIERLRANLRGRDDFIVNKGEWAEFLKTLPR